MIKDTTKDIQRPQNRLQGLENRGFVRLFVMIVVVVAILIYFGIDPKGVWENLIKPVVVWGFDITIKITGFLFDIAIWLIGKVRGTLGI